MKVFNNNECVTTSQAIPNSPSSSLNHLGCLDCSDTSVDYIIHSASQVGIWEYAAYCGAQFQTANAQEAVVISSTCGDGNRETGEECDDGDTDGDDGCDDNCEVEDGWECIGGTATTTDTCNEV